ncbi:hypothetical protein OKW39_000403 [Paraburkholderia sp. MM6662-R1]
MKTTILASAALVGILSLASVGQAQEASGQQDGQAQQAPGQQDGQSASANASSNSAYGGVSGSSSISGGMGRSGWATCGHLPQCNPDSGH